jgi:hypothetical protein
MMLCIPELLHTLASSIYLKSSRTGNIGGESQNVTVITFGGHLITEVFGANIITVNPGHPWLMNGL